METGPIENAIAILARWLYWDRFGLLNRPHKAKAIPRRRPVEKAARAIVGGGLCNRYAIPVDTRRAIGITLVPRTQTRVPQNRIVPVAAYVSLSLINSHLDGRCVHFVLQNECLHLKHFSKPSVAVTKKQNVTAYSLPMEDWLFRLPIVPCMPKVQSQTAEFATIFK